MCCSVCSDVTDHVPGLRDLLGSVTCSYASWMNSGVVAFYEELVSDVTKGGGVLPALGFTEQRWVKVVHRTVSQRKTFRLSASLAQTLPFSIKCKERKSEF